MQYINLPSDIKISALNSLNSILKDIDRLNTDDTEVCFVFSDVDWLSAEMTTLLGMEMRRLQSLNYKLYTSEMPSRVRNILNKNGFNALLLHNTKEPDIYDTTIPYTELRSDSVNQIDSYIDNLMFHKLDQTLATESEQRFKEAVFEVADNTHIHSNSNQIFMCGQHFPQKKVLAFTISDNGVSIPFKVNNSLHLYQDNDFTHDAHLIDWATKRGNSTKTVPAAGLGLSDIMETMRQLGELTIVSNLGYWKFNSSHTIIMRTLESPLHGTLIHFNFLLKQDFATSPDSSNDILF